MCVLATPFGFFKVIVAQGYALYLDDIFIASYPSADAAKEAVSLHLKRNHPLYADTHVTWSWISPTATC